ncbi:MAG: hypothetical protein ACO3XO_03080, partial [Bdellovibrionota bacterium]
PYYPSTYHPSYHTLTSAIFVLLALTISLLGTGCGGGTRGTNISGTGTVRTAANEPVVNSTVTNPANAKMVVTGPDGSFQLTNLGLRIGEATSLTITTTEDQTYPTNTFIATGNSGTLAITLPEPEQPNTPAAAIFIPDGPSENDTAAGEDSSSDASSFEPQPSLTPSPPTRPGTQPTPTPSGHPSPSPSEDGGDGNANEEILAQCVAARFTTIQGIPDLSCEEPCLDDPGSYVTNCRDFISYLAQVFLPFCANEPCAEECELTQLLFSDTRTGAIVAQGYENANCGRGQQEEERNEQGPILR